MTNATASPPPRKTTKWWVWAIFFIVVGVIGYDIIDIDTYRLYLVKPKLAMVQSAIDPVRTGIAAALMEKSKLPKVTTVVTHANQGQPATPDWAALGFINLPGLPREVSSLSLAEGGEIVVTIANIREGIDTTEVRAKPAKDAQGVSWTYQCTSTNDILKRYFHC